MTPDQVLDLFRLPASAVLQRRVAKSDFADQLPAGCKPGDRRLIQDRIEALHWHAALNPANTNLPISANPAATSVPGLAVVTLLTRGPQAAPAPRLVTLVHRAVPDLLILLTAHTNPDSDAAQATTLSIKPALGEVLIAELPVHTNAQEDTNLPALPPQLAPLLAVDRADSLADLHQRWVQALIGLHAFNTLGRCPHYPVGPSASSDTDAKRSALDLIQTLDAKIRKLTAQARRETQAGRRAELNLQLQNARQQRSETAEAI